MEAAVRLAFRGCAVWALRRLPCRLAGFPSPSPGPGQGPPGRESRRARGPPPVFRPQPSAWLHASSPGPGSPGSPGGPGRGAGGPRGGVGGGGEDEEEEEGGDVGTMDPDKEMYRFLRNHRRAVNEHRMRRHFDPGPPERRLTWEAIEHMRFLAQECPGEWPVPRLAAGFGVPRSVVVRVLRGRWAPSAARRSKQDAAALANVPRERRLLPAPPLAALTATTATTATTAATPPPRRRPLLARPGAAQLTGPASPAERRELLGGGAVETAPLRLTAGARGGGHGGGGGGGGHGGGGYGGDGHGSVGGGGVYAGGDGGAGGHGGGGCGVVPLGPTAHATPPPPSASRAAAAAATAAAARGGPSGAAVGVPMRRTARSATSSSPPPPPPASAEAPRPAPVAAVGAHGRGGDGRAEAPPGRLPSAAEMERLADEHRRRPLPRPETRSVGRDVLDHRGNFLYRI